MMRFSFLTPLTAILLFVFSSLEADGSRQVVGATELVLIEEAGLIFKARVDTGAATSSVHAENLVVVSPSSPVGNPVRFLLVNKKGESTEVEALIDSIVRVNTSEGSEFRYKIPLTINSEYSSKTILVTLNDRSRMKYGLLLGRNWLHGDFLVDVDRNNDD